MRVVHVNFARGFRGGERQTLNLMEGLSAFDVDQVLVCRPNSELAVRARAHGMRTDIVSHPILGHASARHGDLIHVHEARGAYWAAIENSLRGTPYIITRRIPNAISKSRLTRNVYRHASQLFGVSADVSQRLAQQTGCNVETILSCCTQYPANEAKVREIRATLHGETQAGIVVGHVGAMHDHHKGQSVLIEAFHLLLKSRPDARLLLVGDGPDRAHFEQLARGDKRIVFAGSQQNVGDWIAAMDVFAFPSREEGLGSSVLDAMALGVPVVSANVGGLPELLGSNSRGLLVDGHQAQVWSESLFHMINQPGLRKHYADEGRAFAQKHCAAAMSRKYLRMYEQLLLKRQAVKPVLVQ